MGLFKSQGAGVREIARPALLGPHPSTVSRELRRNAATRGGKPDYRASVAQWKAELMARRPKAGQQRAFRRARANDPVRVGLGCACGATTGVTPYSHVS